MGELSAASGAGLGRSQRARLLSAPHAQSSGRLLYPPCSFQGLADGVSLLCHQERAEGLISPVTGGPSHPPYFISLSTHGAGREVTFHLNFAEGREVVTASSLGSLSMLVPAAPWRTAGLLSKARAMHCRSPPPGLTSTPRWPACFSFGTLGVGPVSVLG